MDYEPYHSATNFLFRSSKMNFYPDTLEWEKPEEVYACVISLKKKYAISLLQKGVLKFNSPENWVKYAMETAIGRGDLLEGSFKAIAVLEEQKDFSYTHNDVRPVHIMGIKHPGYDLLHFKDVDVIKLPCYCFYLLKNKDFSLEANGVHVTARASIPARYFRGLEDGRSWLEEQKLDEGDRLATVVIGDMDEFIDRIKTALLNLGVPEKSIIAAEVQYMDLSKPYNHGNSHPLELFVKDIMFSDQAEGRIVVNCSDKKIRERLINEPIELGSLEDIAYLDDHYYSGGMEIEFTSFVGRDLGHRKSKK